MSKGNEEGIGDGEGEGQAWGIYLGSCSLDFKAAIKTRIGEITGMGIWKEQCCSVNHIPFQSLVK